MSLYEEDTKMTPFEYRQLSQSNATRKSLYEEETKMTRCEYQLMQSNVTRSMMVHKSCRYLLFIGPSKKPQCSLTLSELQAKATDLSEWLKSHPSAKVNPANFFDSSQKFGVDELFDAYYSLSPSDDQGVYTFFENGEESHSVPDYIPTHKSSPKDIINKLEQVVRNRHTIDAIRFYKVHDLRHSMDLGSSIPDDYDVINNIDGGHVEFQYPAFYAEGKCFNGDIVKRIIYGPRPGVSYRKFVAEFTDSKEIESVQLFEFDDDTLLTEDDLKEKDWFNSDSLKPSSPFHIVSLVIISLLLFAVLITIMTVIGFHRRQGLVERILVMQDGQFSSYSTSPAETPDAPPDKIVDIDTINNSDESTDANANLTLLVSFFIDLLTLVAFLQQWYIAAKRAKPSNKQTVALTFRLCGTLAVILQIVSAFDTHMMYYSLECLPKWFPMVAHLYSTMLIHLALIMWSYSVSESVRKRKRFGRSRLTPCWRKVVFVSAVTLTMVLPNVSLIVALTLPCNLVWFPYALVDLSYCGAQGVLLIYFAWALVRMLSVSVGKLPLENQEGTLNTIGRILVFTLFGNLYVLLYGLANGMWISEILANQERPSELTIPSDFAYLLHSIGRTLAVVIFLWYSWIPSVCCLDVVRRSVPSIPEEIRDFSQL
eukprot:403662_1